MSINDEMEPMLSLKEVATLLHVHINTVRRWSDRGLLKSYQINRRGDRRFRQKDITQFLTSMNSDATKDAGNGNSLL
jgi:excisionase family DNA binding protein